LVEEKPCLDAGRVTHEKKKPERTQQNAVRFALQNEGLILFQSIPFW
jgi:hypothetical protein